MTGILLDTHAWAWSIYSSVQLSDPAKQAMREAETIWVSPVSAFEISQKVRLRKWPEMDAFADRLVEAARRQQASMARLDMEICTAAGRMTWAHRDPFDRLLAATALSYKVPIVSTDEAFDGIVTRIW